MKLALTSALFVGAAGQVYTDADIYAGGYSAQGYVGASYPDYNWAPTPYYYSPSPSFSPYQPYQPYYPPQNSYNPVTTAVLANQFGGGFQGALVANNLQGNGGFSGGNNNLLNTVVTAQALGGTGFGTLGGTGFANNYLLASALSQPSQPQPYYPGQPYYPQNNNNNLLNTVATASVLGGSSGLGGSNLAPLLLLQGNNGFGGSQAIQNGLIANQFGGGFQGALVANSLNNGGRGGNNNLGTTLLLSNALGGTTSTGLGGNSQLGNLLVAQQLTQPSYPGRGGGNNNNLLNTYAYASVLGGTGSGGNLDPLLTASLLANNNNGGYNGGYNNGYYYPNRYNGRR